MKIVFRTDASVDIGTGHVMRCAAMADFFRKTWGAEIVFICRRLSGDLCGWLEAKGYLILRLPPVEPGSKDDRIATENFIRTMQARADWLIVDHYQIDKVWETPLRSLVKHILVIDDLADREHECDVLLDQNLYPRMDQRYKGKVSIYCKQLLGPKYAMLREEFYTERSQLPKRDGQVKRILVFLGGSDPFNTTIKVMDALNKLSIDAKIDIVIGASNPYRDDIERVASHSPGMTTHFQVTNMAALMAKADVAVGAGGITIWERCYLGLPSFTVLLAENQRLSTETVAQLGATWNLGWHDQCTADEWAKMINQKLGLREELKKMEQQCYIVMGDGQSQGIPAIAQQMAMVGKEAAK